MACILIADDDPAITALLARMLSRLGHTIHIVHDGRAALSCLEQRAFDVLITDLEMPLLTGAELVRLLAARSPGPRVLIASGSVVDAETITLADGLLAKPFGLPEVAAALAGLPRARRQYQAICA
jgi:CheY-like chemotaxis protein